MAAPRLAQICSFFCIFPKIYAQFYTRHRFKYVRFMRQVMAQASDATLDDISILYRSKSYIVVNKRYDVLINEDSGGSQANPSLFGNTDVAKQLFHLVPDLADPKLEHHFRFIHRLDFATSGVLCLGLTRRAAGKAATKFQQRLVTKHYLALVRNTVSRLDENSELTVSAAIGNDKSALADGRFMMTTACDPNCEDPKPCVTRMVLLETGTYDGEPASKVLLIPKTGRTHQLRVHSRHVGHRIIGDYAYSNRTDIKPYRMMLHAFRLVIPLKDEHLDITAPDPFTPETDSLWQPDKVVRTYNEYVKDLDFKKTLSQDKPQQKKNSKLSKTTKRVHKFVDRAPATSDQAESDTKCDETGSDPSSHSVVETSEQTCPTSSTLSS